MAIRSRVSLWESVIAGATAWLVLNVFAYAAAPLFGAIHPNLGGIVAPGLGAGGTFPGFLGLGFAGISGVALSVLAHLAFGVTLGTMAGMQERGA